MKAGELLRTMGSWVPWGSCWVTSCHNFVSKIVHSDWLLLAMKHFVYVNGKGPCYGLPGKVGTSDGVPLAKCLPRCLWEIPRCR